MALTHPIVVLGMHRSGTTMLVRWLMRAGVHMGLTRDPNEEAYWFLRWNKRLLAMAGARWDHPEPWLRLCAQEALVHQLGAWLRRELWRDTGGLRSYLGRFGWLRFRLFGAWPLRWGYKDPRTTLTWPVWRQVWPGAHVLCIVRHGVDVAASLVRREEKLLAQTLTHFPDGPWRVQSPRCWELADAFKLWETYLEAAQRWQSEATQNERWLCVRYEDLLMKPHPTIQRVARFLGLAHVPKLDANPQRAYAHTQDPQLAEMAQKLAAQSPLLRQWYSEAAQAP